MEHLLAWLDDPVVKYLLALVGSFLLKRWPAFVNRAIIATGLIASLILSVLHALFPVAVANAQDSLAVVQHAVVSVPWWKWLATDVLMPVVLAWGTHTGVKNGVQWARGQAAVGGPAARPFQFLR